MRALPKHSLALALVLFAASAFAWAQSPDGTQAPAGQEGGRPRGQGQSDAGPRLAGKITAIHGGTLELMKIDGSTVSIKISDKTELRKDRQPAKLGDFKTGDLVLVRGDENPDHTVSAQLIAGRTGSGAMGGGPGGGGRMGGGQVGTMGKDFVIGEVKSIDPPNITVLRTDNITQTIELNEETSLRKGRDSITMADIQVGDHLFARGASPNNSFAPKMVMLIEPEQWKRMQEFAEGAPPQAGKAPRAEAPGQKPTGPNN